MAGTSTHRGRRTLRLDVGKVAAAVPVTLLLAGGVAWAVDRDAPVGEALPVPAEAVELPSGASGRALEDDLGFQRVPGGAGPVLPAAGSSAGSSGAQQVSSGQVRIDRSGVPARALQAYQRAEQLLAAGDPSCHLDWSLVAAIGRVESAHGSFGGNRLGTDGVARPGIVGIALDGSRGIARITDTDGGRWDGDGRFDRAVGPMQFIPGTWRTVGVDADGDGSAEPQDVDDAATATGVYLCSGPGDLRTAGDRYRAVYRYNHSDDYVRTVLAIADAYARGVDVVEASALPGVGGGSSSGTSQPRPSAPATSPTSPAAPASTPAPSAPPATAAPAPTPSAPASTAPAGVVEGVVGAVTTLLPTLPPAAPTTPAPPAPTVPAPTVPPLVPGLTCVLEPVIGSLLPLCPTPTP